MSTPCRARKLRGGSRHSCTECGWSGDHGAEDHTERTGHRTRADHWVFFEKHCDVEAHPPDSDRMLSPPGIEGRALFFEPADYVQGSDWYEILKDPTWKELTEAASRIMVATEDTHHCFFEDFHRLDDSDPGTWAIRARAIDSGLDAYDLPVYRFSMGS